VGLAEFKAETINAFVVENVLILQSNWVAVMETNLD